MSILHYSRVRSSADGATGKVIVKFKERNSEHESGEHLGWVLKCV